MDDSHVPRPPSANRRLAILRIAEQTTQEVIILANGPVMGMLTHYHKPESWQCHGKDCKACTSGDKRVWKGYHPVLQLDRAGHCYVPAVLEVTEALELDFRDRLFRGGEWTISRGKSTKTKRAAVLATQLGQRQLPADCLSFDCHAAVHVIYHDWTIRLEQTSPLPARLMVATVKLTAVGQATDQKPEATPEEKIAQRQRLDALKSRLLNGVGSMPKGGDQ